MFEIKDYENKIPVYRFEDVRIHATNVIIWFKKDCTEPMFLKHEFGVEGNSGWCNLCYSTEYDQFGLKDISGLIRKAASAEDERIIVCEDQEEAIHFLHDWYKKRNVRL